MFSLSTFDQLITAYTRIRHVAFIFIMYRAIFTGKYLELIVKKKNTFVHLCCTILSQLSTRTEKLRLCCVYIPSCINYEYNIRVFQRVSIRQER